MNGKELQWMKSMRALAGVDVTGNKANHPIATVVVTEAIGVVVVVSIATDKGRDMETVKKNTRTSFVDKENFF